MRAARGAPLLTQAPGRGQKRLLWVAIAALAALVVLAKIPRSIELLRVIHKTGHPLVFGLMAIFLSRLSFYRVSLGIDSARSHYIKVLGIIAALGSITEIAQIPLDRGASVLDVCRDLGGASAALCLLWLWRNAHALRPAPHRRFAGIALLGMALVLICVAPLIWCIASYVNRNEQWPVLLKFGSPLDTYFLAHEVTGVTTVRMPAEWAHSAGEMAAQAVPTQNYTAGVRMLEPRPDWHEFDVLAVDVTNPADLPLRLIVRVNDKAHHWEPADRFNGPLFVPPRTRLTERIPLSVIEQAPRGRRMDMRQIAGVAVSTTPASPQKEFLFSRFSLERSGGPATQVDTAQATRAVSATSTTESRQ